MGYDGGELRERARAWRHVAHEQVCDVLLPWAHGTVVRATALPDVYDLNALRVEEDPGLSVAELVAVADEGLAGLAHRRIEVEDADVATPLRAGFTALGWHVTRLVWMHHDGSSPTGPALAVEEVPYDAVHALRVAWHGEDFPSEDPEPYLAQVRDVALRRHALVLAVLEGGEPVAFAQLERAGRAAEIGQVYVRPDHRGGGRGTAMTVAAIRAAGDVDDLWIVADDEDRPKELYARLGFRPAWTAVEFMRLPG